jgi:hypothetical protein
MSKTIKEAILESLDTMISPEVEKAILDEMSNTWKTTAGLENTIVHVGLSMRRFEDGDVGIHGNIMLHKVSIESRRGSVLVPGGIAGLECGGSIMDARNRVADVFDKTEMPSVDPALQTEAFEEKPETMPASEAQIPPAAPAAQKRKRRSKAEIEKDKAEAAAAASLAAGVATTEAEAQVDILDDEVPATAAVFQFTDGTTMDMSDYAETFASLGKESFVQRLAGAGKTPAGNTAGFNETDMASLPAAMREGMIIVLRRDISKDPAQEPRAYKYYFLKQAAVQPKAVPKAAPATVPAAAPAAVGSDMDGLTKEQAEAIKKGLKENGITMAELEDRCSKTPAMSRVGGWRAAPNLVNLVINNMVSLAAEIKKHRKA